MLELEVVRVEEEASAKGKDETGSLYKDPEYWASPPGSQNLPIPKELYPGDGWVIHTCINENPVNKGTRSLPWQDLPVKPRPETWGDVPANGWK